MREYFNMSCGQAELIEPSKASLARDVITIYSPPFWNMEEEALALFQKHLATRNDIVIVFGTGTSGIEATVNSILEPGDRFLVAHNGLFGEIMSLMVETVGGVPVQVPAPLGSPISPAAIEAALDKDPSIKGIGVVHGETSVGVANPLREIGEMSRERGLLFVVDAISSFASEELRVDDWNIDLCIVNGQKCLGAPQGNTFVSVSPRAWDRMESRGRKIRGFYMNLLACRDYLTMAAVEHKNWNAGRNEFTFQLREAPHPASPSFVILKGVWASLKALSEEGLEHAIARHETAGRAVRAAVEAMGLESMCREPAAADNAVTAIFLPEGIEDFQIRRHLFDAYQVILGDANMLSWDRYRNEIGRQYVRLGTMGEAARHNKVLYALFAFGTALNDLGASVDVPAGLAAASEVYKGAST
jgi:aspartate aminotransferase-like enzyme